jgi:hypothetical protein
VFIFISEVAEMVLGFCIGFSHLSEMVGEQEFCVAKNSVVSTEFAILNSRATIEIQKRERQQ